MAKIRMGERPQAVEEFHFRSESAFLCLLVNRRTKVIRVIDFRAGALPAKRLFIQSIAQREGIEKVLTLVEKDEVSSWTRVGFVREGTIPGFYKRSDGHLCGCVIGERTASIEVNDDGLRTAERTINAAKKTARELEDELGPLETPAERTKGVTLRAVAPEIALSARDDAWSKQEAIGGFDPFGRGVLRLYLEAKSQSAKTRSNFLSAEFQDCFGHALVEVLRSPDGEGETLATAAGLRAFADELKRRSIVSVFGLAAVDDLGLAQAYSAAGFRKTGLLARGIHIVGGRGRRDAILWSRKLLNPGAEDEEQGG